MRRPQGATRLNQLDKSSVMRSALLDALQRRVDVNPAGEVVLPTGTVDVDEVSKVLRALERARTGPRRR